MSQAPYIATALEKFCTKGASQDSLYLTITLAGGVVLGGRFLVFFCFAFCLVGWLLFVGFLWLVVGFF